MSMRLPYLFKHLVEFLTDSNVWKWHSESIDVEKEELYFHNMLEFHPLDTWHLPRGTIQY